MWRTLRIPVVQDITGSGLTNVTPAATTADLEPLIAATIRCGGEIGFGFIQAQSNRPLLRFYVPQPAPVPVAPSFAVPLFQVAARKKAYAAILDGYNKEEANRVQDAERRAVEFRRQLGALLATPDTARATDVWGAITRCAQFLGEPNSADSTSSQYREASLVISDIGDNAHGKHVDQLPGELLIVNGTPIAPDLQALHPKVFESVAAAVRYLLNNQ